MDYVLIVSAKSDIAMSLARLYAENGYNLYLASRKVNELKLFANDIKIRTKRDIQCIELDILDYSSHEMFYSSLKIKPVGVITATGYLGNQEIGEVDFEEARKIIDTNFTGIVSLLNIVSSDFKQKKSGFIVGISSVAGDRGRKNNYLYGSAKAALTTYLSGLRNRLFNDNVHVLTVKPGFVETKMTAGLDLPKKLTLPPSNVAKMIYIAQQERKNILYVKWVWKWIMLIIKHIPEWAFKRMSL